MWIFQLLKNQNRCKASPSFLHRKNYREQKSRQGTVPTLLSSAIYPHRYLSLPPLLAKQETPDQCKVGMRSGGPRTSPYTCALKTRPSLHRTTTQTLWIISVGLNYRKKKKIGKEKSRQVAQIRFLNFWQESQLFQKNTSGTDDEKNEVFFFLSFCFWDNSHPTSFPSTRQSFLPSSLAVVSRGTWKLFIKKEIFKVTERFPWFNLS